MSEVRKMLKAELVKWAGDLDIENHQLRMDVRRLKDKLERRNSTIVSERAKVHELRICLAKARGFIQGMIKGQALAGNRDTVDQAREVKKIDNAEWVDRPFYENDVI